MACAAAYCGIRLGHTLSFCSVALDSTGNPIENLPYVYILSIPDSYAL